MDNRFGGPQAVVLGSVPELNKMGVKTIVTVPNVSGDTYQIATQNEVEIRKIMYTYPHKFRGVKEFLINIKWLATLFSSIFSFSRLIVKENIDIVQVNGLFGFQAAFAAKAMRKPLVWFLIGNVYPKWIVRVLMPLVTKMAQKIVLISDKLREYYLLPKTGHIAAKVSIINTYVDHNKLLCEGERGGIIRKELGLHENIPLVVSVGNVNVVKGYEYLIKAAAIVRRKIPEACFLIVGIRTAQQEFYWRYLDEIVKINRLENNLKFLGQRKDIARILVDADVFCLASTNEGMPIAILEAMTFRLPVVATDVGGISEQVIDQVTGLLVKAGDVSSLADAICRLLRRRDLCAEMGERGRQRVFQLFSKEMFVRKHFELYKDMVRGADCNSVYNKSSPH
jgi:glycosyltransferase involved in cell wall biosynthesis